MRKVITFLGKVARLTDYQFEGKIYSGYVFAEALRKFVDYDKMLVFVTPAAQQETFPRLASLKDPHIKAIPIPDGRTDDEMWQIFEALTGVIEDGDVVIFDITHGFRSIPFFVFLAVAFIKSVRNVTIEAVYYGALELDRPAPVLDLSKFVDLLDWMHASEQFIEFGNARSLATQLREEADELQETARSDARMLVASADALEHTSLAFRLLIPDQAMAASHTILHSLDGTVSALSERVPPLTTLAEKITTAFQPIAFPDPRDPDAMQASLHFERQMVFWYLERHLLLQAIGLAYEWLISWGVYQGDYPDLYNNEDRKKVRLCFNKASDRNSSLDRFQFEPTNVPLNSIPDIRRALNLFRSIRRIRNDLLHAGKPVTIRRDQPPDEWEKDIETRCRELADLTLERARWELLP